MAKEKKQKKQTHIPKTTADSIPYIRVYKNGIFELEGGRFSKSYMMPEANFETSKSDKQWSMAEQFSRFLNEFDSGITIEMTLYNRKYDEEKFKEKIFIPMRSDSLNEYREEYNNMLLSKMSGAKNNLETVKILTITVTAKDVFEAEKKFSPAELVINDSFSLLAKKNAEPLSTLDRLEILYNIYNQELELPFYETRTIQGQKVKSFTLETCAKQGITTKDAIAPSCMDITNMRVLLNEHTYCKSYYVKYYHEWVKGDIFTSFAEIPTTMLTSVYFLPWDTQEGIKYIRNHSTNIRSDLVDKQKKASRSGYSVELISPELQDAKAEAGELLEQITKDNSKLYSATYVFTLFADSEDELKNYESQLKLIGNKNFLTIAPLTKQQEQGLNTALPLGNKQVEIERMLTSETVASFIPFDVKDIREKNGMYYGLNAISGKMILHSRANSLNPNSCILGMPGAGKSFSAKREIMNVRLSTDDEIYVIDPEREYKKIADDLNGAVIKISNSSPSHINPFDLNLDNTDDQTDAVKTKCEFIATICEIMLGGRYGLSPIEKSIIDRCTLNIYDPYIKYLKRTGKAQDFKEAPTLVDFYNELLMQAQPEAQTLALALERYVKGGSNIFSHHTNIDINNSLTIYDIKDIGALKELGLQICLDNIWNKMVENKGKGKRTWFYIDEFYLLMQKPTSAAYISEIWKRARKWNGFPCAITQNVEDMLKSEDARTVINNCAFVTLLGQAPINKQQLCDMFDISNVERKYIESSKPGMGLVIIDNDIIPMNDDFPKDTKMYRSMTTKPDET